MTVPATLKSSVKTRRFPWHYPFSGCLPGRGTSERSDVVSNHFYRLRESCQILSADSLPKLLGTGTPKPLKDAMELEKRLADTPSENTLLVIAIDGSVNN